MVSLLKHHAAWLVVASLLTGCQARGILPPPDGRPGGGELRVLLPFEPRSLDPNSPSDEAALLLASNLFNKLVSLDAEGRLYPDLAASWTVGEGGLSYTFKLRRGVRWHDGRPFTAADVRWTFERLAGQPRGLAAEAIRRIERVETPDDATVMVRLREPWAPFLTTIAWYGASILPHHDPDGIARGRPVGTGPFRLGEWVRGRRVVLAANRSFFRPGPWLDRVVYLFNPDSKQVPGLLLAGAIDYTLARPPLESIPRLEREPTIQVASSPADSRFYCAFNLRRPPLADRRVREAIHRAIDRQEILEQALHGFGAPAFGFYTPAVSWAYNGRAHVPAHDPGRARALLAAAGLRGSAGRPALELELLVPPVSPMPEIAGVLVRQLAAVGIAVRPVFLPLDQLLERASVRHEFDLALLGGSQGPDPESLNVRFGARGPLQVMGYSSPRLAAALAEGARSVDMTQRARAYFRAQDILAHDLPVVPLIEAVRLTIFHRRVHGLPQVEARGLVPADEYSLVRLDPGAGR
jgi:peptide/nickel transport system substrate-binding protein